jgi:hypothetical protein
MRNFLTIKMIALAVIFGSPSARSDVELGIGIHDGELKEFHLAIGNFYKVPENDVVIVRERRIPDEELPVIFFLAQRARVAPMVIVELRLGGRSWLDITHFYGLGAEIYHINVKTVSGPPYGKALGYYKNRPKRDWRYIKLSDDDVINLVNLKFISGHYGYSPDTVIKMRSIGKSFVSINKDAKAKKSAKQDSGKSKQEKSKSGSKHQSKASKKR